jgi:UPF0755 protein
MPPYRYRTEIGAAAAAIRIVAFAALLAGLVFGFMLLPPVGPQSPEVLIAPGVSARGAARALAEAGAIRSATVFSAMVAFSGSADNLVAGRYRIEQGESALDWLWRLRRGETRAPVASITIPEGYDRRQMAATFAGALPEFDSLEFLAETIGEEGYLFPDTYQFNPDAGAETVAARLRATFDTRTAKLRDAVAGTDRTFPQIVSMASIIEREATADSRSVVAGILWRRLDEGMPLQVDAPFVYAIGKGTEDLTKEDLERDDPYNTYVNKGLPPTPISSPGLAALEAAAYPKDSPYRYFLTGKDGEMHYARTFEEHKANREKYLD